MRPYHFATTTVVGLTLAALCPAQRPAPAATLSGKEIFQRTLKSVTWIVQAVEAGGNRVRLMTGSGSLIDVPKRLVLTNYHVVGDAKEVAVFFPQFDQRSKQLISDKEVYFKQLQGRTGYIRGAVIARSPKQDLALIELPTLPHGTTPVRLARESVGPGDTVHSIGNPGASGALWAYTPGSVKAVYRKKWSVASADERSIMRFEAQVVETTSPVNAGDSGGPLLNSAGELVAVTQGGALDTQGTISFFIDLSEVQNFLKANKIHINSAPGSAATTLADTKTEPKGDAKSTEAPAKAAEASDAEKQEKLAEQKLRFAKDFISSRPSIARERLEVIVKDYPTTKAAGEAKELLKTLKK
jgi:S1-C subfamily serine protease